MVFDSRATSPDPSFEDDRWQTSTEGSEHEVAPYAFAWSSEDDDEPDLDYADENDLDDDDDLLADLDDDVDDDDLDLDDDSLDDDF